MKTLPFLLAATLLTVLAVNVPATVLYVDLNSTNPVPPYADWSTAATNIQDAVDAATDGDQILVTDGVYQTGGRVVYGSLTNRVVINKAVTVQSANGPTVTVIQGYQDTNTIVGDDAVRCVYLTNNASLIGFTLTNGATLMSGDGDKEQSGGGVWCESSDAVVSNCVIAGNSANLQGGGAMRGTLSECVLSNNLVPLSFNGFYPQGSGGGAQSSVLNNCFLIANYAGDAGGGADGSMLNNCVLAGNAVNDAGGAAASATLNGCSITNNSAGYGGGGVELCVLDDCNIDGNFSFYGGGADASTLNNCTLAANSGNSGGGALNSTLVNCALSGNSTYDSEVSGAGGGASGSTLDNCLLFDNSSSYGGGADGCALNNCTLTGNSAANGGGGADSSILNNCDLTGNWVGGFSVKASIKGSKQSGPTPKMVLVNLGGGAENSTLNNCTLIGNQAYNDGDLYADAGGGADSSTLNNCIVMDNGADFGGGAENSTLNNCTLTGNSAGNNFGGADSSTLNNCIVYYNTNGDYFNSRLNYCCTAQPPDNGIGNITNEPAFVDLAGGDFHLQANSPCINAGNNSYVTTTNDLDGNPRIMGLVVDIGAYEFPIVAAIGADYTNVAAGFVVNFTSQFFAGNISSSILDFGDGTVVSNQLAGAHSWAAPGDYLVTLTVFSDKYPAGISVTITVHVAEGIYYVSLDSTNPVTPYSSWDTAATNIQDAVDAAFVGGTVLVSNGVYQTGGLVVYGSLTNRVVINKAVTVQSVNGPTVTVIQGYQDTNTIVGDDAVRCVYLTNNAALIGFTLTSGATRSDGDRMLEQSGGGAWCESANAIITNCVFMANAANNAGGGAEQGTLNHCTLTGNSAVNNWVASGGGADSSVLNNCELTGNWVGGSSVVASIKGSKQPGPTPLFLISNFGGGAANSTLNNCTLIGNAADGGGGADSSTLNNCIVTGNNAAFGGGAANSTLNNCTVTGNSAYNNFGGAEDSALNNCIVYYNTNGGDYGYSTLNYCCTAQPPGDGIGNITNEPAFVDLAAGDFHLQPNSPCINAGNNSFVTLTNDFDGNPRIKGGTVDIGAYEYQTPTSVISYAWLQQYGLPTDGSADYADTDGDGMNNWNEWRAGTSPTDPSSLLKMTTVTNDVSGITVTWQSVSGINYFLQRSTNLAVPSAFSTIQTDIAGQPGMTSYTDTDATGAGPFFYRVGVQQ